MSIYVMEGLEICFLFVHGLAAHLFGLLRLRRTVETE